MLDFVRQYSPFGTKTCLDINFVRECYQLREANSFPRAKLEKNCELQGTDNVQGKISF